MTNQEMFKAIEERVVFVEGVAGKYRLTEKQMDWIMEYIQEQVDLFFDGKLYDMLLSFGIPNNPTGLIKDYDKAIAYIATDAMGACFDFAEQNTWGTVSQRQLHTIVSVLDEFEKVTGYHAELVLFADAKYDRNQAIDAFNTRNAEFPYLERLSQMSIQTIRQERGLSQQQLAERSGIKLSTLQKLESGANGVLGAQLETITRLAWALDVSIDQIAAMAMGQQQLGINPLAGE